MLMTGLIMTVWGAVQSSSDYSRLSSEQLAWMTIAETVAPELTVTGIGIFLLILGLTIFFASSNKDASRGAKSLFGKFKG